MTRGHLKNEPPPGKKYISDWVGLRVRTKRDISTMAMTIPAGTVMTVSHVKPGLQLQTEPCPTCGVRMFVFRVPTWDVEVVEEVKK